MMNTLKQLIASLLIGSVSFFLFFVGLGVMLILFVVMLIAGFLVKPTTRQGWQSRWSQQWQNRQQSFRHKRTSTAQTQRQTSVIDGQYQVIDENR